MKPDSPRSDSPFAPRCRTERPRPEIRDHTVLRQVGGGAYGEIWLARNLMGTYRAVKVVHRDNFSEARPYEREFEGIEKFERISRSHEGLVDILQIGRGVTDDYFYYVMELADDAHAVLSAPATDIPPPAHGNPGVAAVLRPTPADGMSEPQASAYVPKTLKWVLAQLESLPSADCLKTALQLAEAVEHMHQQGLVHRDIKPSNIIFVNGLPKLADIGLVAAVEESLTYVGTGSYIPPEGPGAQSADVFALGKVLYEMVTGLSVASFPRLPDEWAASPDRAALQELNQVVLTACEAQAKRRYRSAAEMRDELRLLLLGESIKGQRALRRSVARLTLALAAVTALALLGGLIFGFQFYKRQAADQALLAILREGQMLRSGARFSGWFATNWSLLTQAAAIRADAPVLEQAAATLAGLDATLLTNFQNVAGGSVAFAPDGRALVGGTGTNHAMLIDRELRRVPLPVQGDGPVGWAPDGMPLQLTVSSNALVLREANSGRVRREFALPPGVLPRRLPAPLIALTPDGTRVAVATDDRQVRAWDTATGKPSGSARTQAPASALAFSPDGALLATGGEDGSIEIFSTAELARVARLAPAVRPSPILCLAFGPDRVVREQNRPEANRWWLASGDQGGRVVIWDLHTGQPRTFCRGSPWNVQSVAFHPDGLTLASAGRNEARLWDTMSGRLLLLLRGDATTDAPALAFDAAGGRILCGRRGADSSSVALWELEPHRGIQALRGLDASVRKIWLSRDSRRVAALSDDWQVAIWETRTGRLAALLQVPVGNVADNAGGAFGLRDDEFAFASWNTACLYDLSTHSEVRRWILPNGLSEQLQFDAHGRLLLLRRERGPGQHWYGWWRLYQLKDSPTPTLLYEQSDPHWFTVATAFPAGGERFLAWNTTRPGDRRSLRAYDVASGAELTNAITTRTNGELRVFLDPTGRWFGYTPDASDRLQIVNLHDLKPVMVTPDHCRALGPAGELAVGQHFGWEILDAQGQTTGLPLGLDWDPAFAPSFSPDGRLLAWGTVDGLVLLADLSEAKRRLNSLR